MNYVKRPLNIQTNTTNTKADSKTKKIYPNSPDILDYKIGIVDSYTGYEFEEYLVVLLKALGFRNVKRVGGSGDRGGNTCKSSEAAELILRMIFG